MESGTMTDPDFLRFFTFPHFGSRTRQRRKTGDQKTVMARASRGDRHAAFWNDDRLCDRAKRLVEHKIRPSHPRERIIIVGWFALSNLGMAYFFYQKSKPYLLVTVHDRSGVLLTCRYLMR